MLKVYGVTYDHTTNYGSCFQAYALQSAIERVIINGENCSFYLIPLRKIQGGAVKRNNLKQVLYPFFNMLWNYHRLQFKSFENRYMKYVAVLKMSDLIKLNDTADAFVCGSDVIWSTDYNHGLGAYYLDFAKKYAFSYAASFGKAEIAENQYSNLRPKLENLNRISVRENCGADIVNRIIGKKPCVVLDPVFLLTRDEWNQLIKGKKTKQKNNYIFVYTVYVGQELRNFVKLLKKQTGLDVIYSTCGPKQAVKQGIIQVHTPQEWLQLLRDADYVVTNSFHGTAFSMIYHKKFFTVLRGEKTQGYNVRMTNFLQGVGMENRLYTSVPDIIDNTMPDYVHADFVLRKQIEFSLNYLCDCLESAYHQKPCL